METVILTIIVALGGYLKEIIGKGLDKLEVAAENNAIAKKVFEVLVDAIKAWEPKNPT